MIQITLLGGFAVQCDDGSQPLFRSDKVRALLAYLVVEAEQPHTRASLAALFWPEQREEVARNNLSQTLVQLRRAIGDAEPPLLLITRQTIQWNHASPAQCDATEFARLARSFAAAEQEQAAALYRGALLHGFSLPECEAFEEWLIFTREHLEQLALQALDALTGTALAAGMFDHAAAYAHRQLALDRWREAAYRQLMLALAWGGQRATALAQYKRCREVLQAELQVEPDAATTALAEQIRAGELAQRVGLPPAPAAAAGSGARDAEDTAPDLGAFYGREHELETVRRWVVDDSCRLVVLTGLGGVGKTALAARTAQRVAPQFGTVIWRSLLNAPPCTELLRGVLDTLSAHQFAALPATLDEQIDLLIQELRRQRCLLVLDNAESILQAGVTTPEYRAGYAEYGQLLLRVGQSRHRSCLLVTSREQPPEFLRLMDGANGQGGAVRALVLGGLEHAAAAALLQHHGLQSASTAPLVQHYSGHPLALKLVAHTIRDFYAGDVAKFLHDNAPIFDDIRAVLDAQFARLTRSEQDVLLALAIARESASLGALRAALLGDWGRTKLLEAVRSLQRRSLVETHGERLGLQNVVTEYLSEWLIKQAYHDVIGGALDVLTRHALLKTDVKEYVRQSQRRLLLQPLAQRLIQTVGEAALRSKVRQLLETLRQTPRAPGYAAGNLLNLLVTLGPVRDYDFSRLCVWQADLRNAEVQRVSFAEADLANARFTDTFASITSVQFTPDGEQVLASCADGTLRLWRVRDGHALHVFTGHTGVVWSAAISPNGRWCASGGADQTVRIWEIATGQVLHVLRGHTHVVETVAWSGDSALVASGSWDSTVQVWAAATGERLHLLRGHVGVVEAVAFAPPAAQRALLASAGSDATMYCWDLSSGTLAHKLAAGERTVLCLAWSPDGTSLVSGGYDPALRLWDATTWQMRRLLTGHTDVVTQVAWSPDGMALASGSYDDTVRLWDVHSGQVRCTLHGHTGWVEGVAFSADGATLASGGSDQTVRLWNVQSGQVLYTLVGYNNWIPALAFSAMGDTLVSGNWDHAVRVWDLRSKRVRHTLYGHTARVSSVACSRDGRYAASGSPDGSVCIWDIHTGQLRHRLRDHTAGVTGVALHPDRALLASSSSDGSVRIRDLHSGTTLHTITKHTDQVTAVAFSPDGSMLASGSRDYTLRVWRVDTWDSAHTFVSPASLGRVWSIAWSHGSANLASGHTGGPIDVWSLVSNALRYRLSGHVGLAESLAFTPDGSALVSAGDDALLRIWDLATGQERRHWLAHPIRAMAVTFQSQDDAPASQPPLLASGGCEDVIKLWDLETATCAHILRADGPYEGMDIVGATGLNPTQQLALRALGAVVAPELRAA